MGIITKFPKPAEKTAQDKLVDALFQALPATSHKEIARCMSKELHRKVALWEVGQTLWHLRKHSQQYGWTVPPAQNGRKAKLSKGPRFFHVLVERGRDPEFDTAHQDELHNGLCSTISHAATALQHQADALFLAASYCSGIAAKKWVRSLGRRTKVIAEDAHEVMEMLSDENGAA